ncbi:MAG: riboflavin biosynthesis protein RibF [Candidatus Eremiobacteraeota bacterium]|nr:riboflavin biosynthesis protein RibF [Candidatus Eremiobacteraeota bacterium]
MKIYHELFRDVSRPLVLAIGFFDGMHRGHREIVRAAQRMRKPGWRCGILSFANHPASFLRPGTEPPMLTTDEERIDLFAAAGAEECFFIRFDESIAMLEPETFLDRLIGGLGVRGIAVGPTFRFGRVRAGDTAMMREYLAARDVAFVTPENVDDDGERISSSRIRTLVRDGKLELADRLLGHSYELCGTVELGAGRGHDLGFPTANVAPPPKLLPKDGVYSALARHEGRDYSTLVSIGTNPHFGGSVHTIEAWLRDFRATIYGRQLVLRDLRYVREQRAFASVDELVAQMQSDRRAVAYPSY